MPGSYGEWEPVIGLEVHAQLLTRTKLFCACETSFGDAPNTHTCPVCLGLPGALPVPNRVAVELAITAALALGATIEARSVFARKNYFYADLPKGYQISQYEEPLARHGKLEVSTAAGPRAARILRVHMEEDAGKSLHHRPGGSVVDLNRAGTPLIEIVGEPDLRAPEEAGDYLRKLREILMASGVNDGNLEQGSFRCDANVSVRRAGTEKLGVRTELKNINSFRFVEEAIDHEIRRQIALLESGGKVTMATRGYNAEKRETYLLREKETDADYRYFPDPDLLPLVIDDAFVQAIRARAPELPEAKRARWVETLGLTPYAAQVLTGHPAVSAFFDAAVRLANEREERLDPIKIGNFIQAELLRDVTTTGLDASIPISAAQLVELVGLVHAGTISGKQAKDVYAAVRGTTKSPREVVESSGTKVLGDAAELERIAREIVAANAKQASQYKAGKTALLGYFVGQMMKATGGRADPAIVNDVFRKVLSE
jgi:aspartyl-tRNA(Asn)/glutamyl-tRNA(Gln) amidotransferase subunit B